MMPVQAASGGGPFKVHVAAGQAIDGAFKLPQLSTPAAVAAVIQAAPARAGGFGRSTVLQMQPQPPPQPVLQHGRVPVAVSGGGGGGSGAAWHARP